MTAATADWQGILAKRTNERLTGRLRPSGVAKNAVYMVPVTTPALDVPARCAKFIVSTPTPDRSQDVVRPEGCLYDNFKNNPLAYFDHGLSGISKPIGKWQDPDGNLTLKITDDGIEGTLYFADTPEANDIWSLVEQGVLKCASINMTPLDAEVRTNEATNRGRPGLDIKEWELLEISVVGIPDNPEALRKAIAGGQITSQPLLKSFQGFAPMTKSIKKSADEKPDDEAAATAGDENDDPTDADDENAEARPGAKALKKCYGRMSKAHDAAVKEAGQQENEKVRDLMQSHADVCKGEMESFQKCHKSEYGAELKDESDGDGEDGSEMKSLAQNVRTPRQMRGLLGVLKDLARAKNVTQAQRRSIFAVCNRCDQLIGEAIEKAAETDESHDEFATLRKQLSDLTKKAASLMPANA